MFWQYHPPKTSCYPFGTQPASFRATLCLKNGQLPASWFGKPCRKFGCHKAFAQETSCFLGDILPQIWMSQGEEPVSLCLLVWNILLQKRVTTCLVGWNVLPPCRGNSLPYPLSHTLPTPCLPLDSFHLPLACPPWTGSMGPKPVLARETHDEREKTPMSTRMTNTNAAFVDSVGE